MSTEEPQWAQTTLTRTRVAPPAAACPPEVEHSVDSRHLEAAAGMLAALVQSAPAMSQMYAARIVEVCGPGSCVQMDSGVVAAGGRVALDDGNGPRGAEL